MTDRHAGYIITLDRDVREDDAQAIMTALAMTKGVASVTPVTSDAMLQIAVERVKADLQVRAAKALRDLFGP